MRLRLLPTLLVISLLVNVALVAAAWRVAAPRGGWSWLIGKMGVVENEYAPARWKDDRATVFRLVPHEPGDVVFLGDSITNGFPWAEAFPGHRVHNRALDGDTTLDLSKRLDDVIATRPAAVFVMIGINDLLQGSTPDAVAERVTNIVHRLRASSPPPRVYVQSVLPVLAPAAEGLRDIAGDIASLNNEVRHKAALLGAEYVDLHGHFTDANGHLRAEFVRDNVHINAKAYAIWRDIVAPLVSGPHAENPAPAK
ncbi:MAG: hypothetical protein K8S99_02980 [Planctomycetes bacterium]|nr:hypothetical protein [Planctomycetota bacterium]